MIIEHITKRQFTQLSGYLIAPLLVSLIACGGGAAKQTAIEVIQNTAPVLSITTPSSSSSSQQGVNVTFSGTANDAQDGDLSENIAWSSNLDGDLGMGASLSVADLSVGTHTITAVVTDSGSLSGRANIAVSVTQTNNPNISDISDTDNGANEVAEFSSIGIVVGITAFATDAGESITYSLSSDANGRFAIDTNSGVVSVLDGTLLDANSSASHNITVMALSSDGSSSSSIFSITVIDDGCAVQPNQPTIETYTISWNAISDSDLTGFKLYYGTTAALTKSNALGSIDIAGNVSSTIFDPSNVNLLTCQTTYIALSSVGARPESSLSDMQSVVVE